MLLHNNCDVFDEITSRKTVYTRRFTINKSLALLRNNSNVLRFDPRKKKKNLGYNTI